MMIIKTDSKFFWIVAGMNDNTDGALVAAQRVAGPYPSSIRYYIPLNGLLTKYIADAASYGRLDQEHYIWCSWGPMLLPMQITLSLWKEGLHILTIKISNKFFFQNSISFILGCFTKFRHYKKLQQATKRQMWRRGRFLELSRLLNQREGARGVMTIGNAHASLVLPPTSELSNLAAPCLLSRDLKPI